jgi:(S)-2-hydroxy-acid oxidase
MLLNVDDYEREAERVLDPGAFGYFAGGAGDELTLRDNLEAFSRWQLRPRVLVDVGEVTTASTVLGREVSMPLLVAPTAFQRLAHPDGEVATARAAAEAGTVMCQSTLSSVTPAELAAAAPGARLWFQLYWSSDRGFTADLLASVVEAGFEGVIVSNHGGRQLDGVAAALDALPEVVEAVRDDVEVLLDGGVRRGADVLKTLALGARAVLVGRPPVWGLAVGGKQGVREVLELLRAEIALGLTQLGCRSPDEVTSAHVKRK